MDSSLTPEAARAFDAFVAAYGNDRDAGKVRDLEAYLAAFPGASAAIARNLQKLLGYRLGQEVSDRQWRDVLGVLKVAGDRLDTSSLSSSAATAGLTDLLQRATTAAGRGDG